MKTVGVFGWSFVLSAALAACGSGDSHKAVRACPEDCPAEQCEEATGKCLPPDDEPAGGAPSGGAPNDSGMNSAGAGGELEQDTTAPVVTLASPMQGEVVGPTVTFEFEANEPATFTCTLDDMPVKRCKPGITLDDLDSGENTFSVVATDAAGNASDSVEVMFTVDRAPTIDDVAPIVTPEDTSTGAITFTVGDPDSALEDLVVTGSLDSGLPIPASGLILGGSGVERSVTLTPALNAFGPAVLTLSVSDGFATTTKDVPVTVTPVNDPPTIEDVPNKRVAEREVLGPVTFRVSDVETPAKDLVVTAQTSDATKVPLKNIVLGGEGEARTFTITPALQQSGTVTITLTVSDGELTAQDKFVVTLASVDDEPSISPIADQTTPEDTPKTVAFTVSDPDTDVKTLTPSASFAPDGIVKSVTFAGAGANRTLTVTPKPNQTGTATITITISDASGGVSSSFVLTVTPVNDAPTVKAPANQTIDEDTSTGALPFSVADVDSPTVTVTASSSDTTLIPNANIVVAPASSGPGSRNVTITPPPNLNGGPVTITLTASDGKLTGKGTFTVTVKPVNDPPTISKIGDQLVEPDTSTGNIAFSVADIDGDTPLSVTAQSSVLRVVPAANITLGGSGASRTIALLPGANQGGSSTITVTVSDGRGGSASESFVLSAKVKVSGNVVGNGSVIASGTGCPGGNASCAALPGAGKVTFVATPDAGASFVNWSGACSGSGNGVVSPIPSAGVTCTANFRNLWARLFYTPDDLPTQVATSARGGVVETSQALHYLASESYQGSTTSVIWRADLLTGAVTAGSTFAITRDGTPLPPIDLTTDPGDATGTVALINVPGQRGSGLLWLDDANKLLRARSYESDDTNFTNVPYALTRNGAGGLAFVETTHNTSPVAVFPTYAQLVRVNATGAVVGGTNFSESLDPSCIRAQRSQSYLPTAVAVNSDGQYLVAGGVPPVDGSSFRMNLTLFDPDGVPLWGKHFEATDRSLVIVPEGVTASGTSFFVTGIMGDGAANFDGFALSVTADSTVNWWRSFGNPGTQEAAVHGALRGNDFVITGWAAQQGANDLFALNCKADGSLFTGLVYGSGGNDQGTYITPAPSIGGFNLFGGSLNSFGNSVQSTWALRVDQNLQIQLQTGAVSGYEPVVVDQPLDNVSPTCVSAATFTLFTPVQHVLNANPSAVTVGGAFQATP